MYKELLLRLFLEWGVISYGEYLRRMHPEPKHTYDELEAANWSPDLLGF